MRSSGNIPYERGFGPRISAIVHKFGINRAAVSTGIGSTVWGGTTPPTAIYQWPTAPTVASFAGGVANAGFKFFADGLDENKHFKQEEITLDGAGNFTTSSLWWAGWRMAPDPTSPAMMTTTNLTMTVDTKIVALAEVAAQQTQQCVYQVPVNQCGFLKLVHMDPAKNDDSEGSVATQALGAMGFRMRDNLNLYTTNPGRRYGVDGLWSDGLPLEPGERIELRALAAAGTDRITGHFLIGLFDL